MTNKPPPDSPPEGADENDPVAMSALAGRLPPKDILEALPENVRISVIEAASFSGPLPPPSLYREYNEVVPGSAERILGMAEKNQEHRHSWETNALNHAANDRKREHYLGFGLMLIVIFATVYLAVIGQTVVACVLGGGASIVGVAPRLFRAKSEPNTTRVE